MSTSAGSAEAEVIFILGEAHFIVNIFASINASHLKEGLQMGALSCAYHKLL